MIDLPAARSEHQPKAASPADPRRASFMVIRVWMEPGEGGMRGRIVRSGDAEADSQDAIAVSTPDAVYDSVRDWLEDFLISHAVEH